LNAHQTGKSVTFLKNVIVKPRVEKLVMQNVINPNYLILFELNNVLTELRLSSSKFEHLNFKHYICLINKNRRYKLRKMKTSLLYIYINFIAQVYSLTSKMSCTN
jgi:hypothetical protein